MKRVDLDAADHVSVGMLPNALRGDVRAAEDLWSLHPREFPRIRMHGRWVELPRWQQAYGRDYHFSGQTSRSVPVPARIAPLLDWARGNINNELNGVLANWYEGQLGHYIGPHRDSVVELVAGTPIATLVFGEGRKMRFRPHGGSGFQDVPLSDGAVLVIPWETNQRWTHEVPKSRKAQGRRVSLTMRAFR